MKPCLLTVSAPPAYTDAADHFIMVSSIDPGVGGSFLRRFAKNDGAEPSFFICSLTNSYGTSLSAVDLALYSLAFFLKPAPGNQEGKCLTAHMLEGTCRISFLDVSE